MSASDSDSSSMLLGGSAATSLIRSQQSQPQQCYVCHMRFTYTGFLAHLQSDTHRENLNREQRQKYTDRTDTVSASGGGSFKRPDPSELRLSPRLLADSDDSRFGRGGRGGDGGGNGGSGGGRGNGTIGGRSGDRVKRLLHRDADRHRRTEALLAETASKIRQFRQERLAAASETCGTPADSRQQQQDRRRRPEPVGDAAGVDDTDVTAVASTESGGSTCRTVGSSASATSSLLTPSTMAVAAGGAAKAAAAAAVSSTKSSTAATTTTVTPLETVRSNDEFEAQQSRRRGLTKLLRDAAVLTEDPPSTPSVPSSRRSDSATQFPTPRSELPINQLPVTPPSQPATLLELRANFDDDAASPIASIVSSSRRSREVERMQAALELSLQEDELEAGIEEVDGRIASLMEQIDQLRAGIEAEEAVKQQLLERKGSLTQRRVAILKESFQIPEEAVFAAAAAFASLSPRPSQHSPYRLPSAQTPRHQLMQLHPSQAQQLDSVTPTELDEIETMETPRQPSSRLLDGVEVVEAYDEYDNETPVAVELDDETDDNSTDTIRHQLVQKVLETDKLVKKQQQQQQQAVDSPRDAELINSTLSRLLQPLPDLPPMQPPNSARRHLQQQQKQQNGGFSGRATAVPEPPLDGPPPEVLSDVLSSRSRQNDQPKQRPASAAGSVFPKNCVELQQQQRLSTNASSASSDAGSARRAPASGGGGSFRRAASETQLRRSRPRRQDPEFAAALRDYLHASSSSDVDLDETVQGKAERAPPLKQLAAVEATSGRRQANALSITGRSLDSSSAAILEAREAADSSRSSATVTDGRGGAVVGVVSSTSDDTASSFSAPGLVFPGRISVSGDGNSRASVAIRSAAVQLGFLFTATADGAIQRYSLRTHRCMTVYRPASDPSYDADYVACLLLTPTTEPLVLFAEGAALVGHDARTGARLRRCELPSPATAACLRWGAVYVGCADGRVVKYDLSAESLRIVVEVGNSTANEQSSTVTSIEAALQQPGGRRVLLRGCSSTPDLLVADERTGQLLARLRPNVEGEDQQLDAEGPVLAIRVAPGSGIAFAVSRRRLLAHRISVDGDPAPLWHLPAAGGVDFTCLHLGMRSDWLFLGQSDGSVLCFCLDQQRPHSFPDTPAVRLGPSSKAAPITSVTFYDVGRHVVCGDAAGCLVISDSLPAPLPLPPTQTVSAECRFSRTSTDVPPLNFGGD